MGVLAFSHFLAFNFFAGLFFGFYLCDLPELDMGAE
jgi:hypothetical protein